MGASRFGECHDRVPIPRSCKVNGRRALTFILSAIFMFSAGAVARAQTIREP